MKTLSIRISIVLAMTFAMNTVSVAHDIDEAPTQPHLKSWSKKIPKARERFVVLSAFSRLAVLDKETGIVWERAPATKGVRRAWIEAMGDCYEKNIGGRYGWRLPTIEELATLIDPRQPSGKPVIDPRAPLRSFLPQGHPFKNVEPVAGLQFWSSTTLSAIPLPNAFTMRPSGSNGGFIGGGIKQYNDAFAWCVRGGSSPAPDTTFENWD